MTTDAATSGEPGSGAEPVGAALTGGTPAADPRPAQTPEQVVIPDNWKQALPEDLQANPTIANLSGVEDMAKMLVHSQKMVGAKAENSIVLPETSDDAEGWNKVWSKLGKPEKAEGYEIQVAEGAPQNEAFVDTMRNAFHQHNLTADQAKGMSEAYQAFAAEQMEAQTQNAINEATDQIEALKREWGAGYDAQVELAKRATAAFDPSGKILNYLESDKVQGRADIYRMMAAIGQKMSPDAVPQAGKTGGEFAITPAEADGKIKALQADGDFMKAYSDRNHPQHTESVQRMTNLHIAKAGGA